MNNFLDFDKNQKVFYNNLWLDDFKVVVKIPILEDNPSKKQVSIEKFDLTKYLYLFAVD